MQTSSALIRPNILYRQIILALCLFAGLYLSSLYSYLLFHALAELFSILVAWMVFILAWNSRPFLNNGYLLFLGVSLLFVGAIDLVHTLAYQGMGIFQGYDANLPTQLWIAARYLQSLTLLVAPFWINRPLKPGWALAGFSLVTVALISSIFAGFFPDSYIEGSGLTPFKVASEYVIDGILALSILLLFRYRASFNRQLRQYLVLAILAGMASELAFTFYVSVYGLSNLIGHYFKIVAFYFIYKAIIETGFTQPFELLLHDLRQREAALQVSHNQLEQVNAHLQEAAAQAEQRAEQLEAVFAELNGAQTALQDYTARLETSNRELEQFASVASHDLQEPLRKVVLFGARLQDRLAEKMDDTESDYLRRMIAAAGRMQTMIDALLTYARVTTKAQPYEPVDLQEIAQGVISDLEARLEQTCGRVELGYLPVIEADWLQMRQLLQNLIGNALKFHRPGVPVLVKVYSRGMSDQRLGTSDQGLRAHSWPPVSDHLSLSEAAVADHSSLSEAAVPDRQSLSEAAVPDRQSLSEATVTILIEDNGIGFDTLYLERIFKPFERLHGRSEYEGTGMGLAICQKIVERHHGTISATSTPGEGSTFLISLPLKQSCQVESLVGG